MKHTCLVIALVLSFVENSRADGDLAIGTCKKTHRPNILVAWRNSQRILEVEVEVKNLGDEQASGQLALLVLAEDGTVLATTQTGENHNQRVTLPSRSRGGDEGKIVQVKGNLALNLLIDQLDRANVSYMLKASVIPEGPDASPENNDAVKTFNISSRLKPNAHQFREFTYRNTGPDVRGVVWGIETSQVPDGWKVDVDPVAGKQERIVPGESVNGFVRVTTPKDLAVGQHVDIRVTACDAKTNEPVYRYEWFAVFDTVAPEITGLSYRVNPDTGLIKVTASVSDRHSMIKEASGVRLEYSTDRGVTFSNRVLAYDAGNFVGPTSFRTEIGPFREGTNVVMKVLAEDIAGNRHEGRFEPINVSSFITGR